MSTKHKTLNFIEQIVEQDLSNGLSLNKLRFRFPPEPNGYLHIGHTKAIGINFGLGEKYNAPVNLRFDDTNPAKEEQEYVDAIKTDISWLGYKWNKEVYSSDYFDQLYEWAVLLIKHNKAYVDSQTSEEMAHQKGSPTQRGTNSPFRSRSIEDNLTLFKEMRKGSYKEGTHVLRAKIDMEHPNLLMRDPIMYRILHVRHHRTADQWCIYPMYDWTHGESDFIEQISHSLCSLEFKPHRELYNWFKNQIYEFTKETYPILPKQREFARLNLSYTIMSKRKLLQLVNNGIVNGWDDPRMPTISGLRRRGYTPEAIRKFIETVGVAKRDNIIDVSLLEFCVREDLNKKADRVMVVLDPVKITINNYNDGRVDWLKAENNPENQASGFRKIPFSKNILIERADFREEGGGNFFRLSLGKEVRLKNAYIIKAETVEKNSDGTIKQIFCSYDPESLSGSGTEASKRKVKGTLHWVSQQHALKVEVREYDRLFLNESPDSQDKDFMNYLNPQSLKVFEAFSEPNLREAKAGMYYQFQRQGYFTLDKDSGTKLVFNKTVGLRDSWSKKEKKQHIQKQPQQIKTGVQKPIERIKQLGKKYINLSAERQQKAKQEILTLATEVAIEDLKPLFSTAKKKIGTRVATILTLSVLLKQGLKLDPDAHLFVTQAKEDQNQILSKEASTLEI